MFEDDTLFSKALQPSTNNLSDGESDINSQPNDSLIRVLLGIVLDLFALVIRVISPILIA